MTDDMSPLGRFQRLTERGRVSTSTGPEDDPLESMSYRAVRRVRTYPFPDVWFTDHTGMGQAFQWAHVRRMVKDGKGTRLTLVWPDGEVALTGRNLHLLEEDIQRRTISEFYQITPGLADAVPPGEPVITTLRVSSMGDDMDRPSEHLALVVPGSSPDGR